MGIVNGKAVILDRCISETAEGNSTKIGTGNYVVAKFMCAKFQKNRAAGFSPAHTQHVHPAITFFSFLFFEFINQGTAQTAEPILTLNTSKEPVLAKEVPLRGQKITQIFFFTPKMVKNPLSHAFQW